MEEKKLRFAISMMVRDVNIFSRFAERAKAMNLPRNEQDYFSMINGIERAMIHLGWTLEEDGERVDCKDAEHIEYMHYKAIKR